MVEEEVNTSIIEKDPILKSIICENNGKKTLNLKESPKNLDVIRNRFYMFLGENFQIFRILEIQKQLKILDFIILILSWISCIISIIASEFNIEFYFVDEKYSLENCKLRYREDSFSTKLVRILRIINIVFTINIIVLLVVHYYIILKISKLKCNTQIDHGLIQNG